MGSPFEEETHVTSVAPGQYRASIDEVWNLFPLPQGGIVTALGLRAMAQELDAEEHHLRTLHTTFVAQVTHGPVAIDTEVLRRGRSMTHLRAEVRNEGSPRGHVTSAVFGASRPGYAFTDLVAPTVPPPGACRSFREPPPAGATTTFRPAPFWQDRMEGRAALGHAPWEDYEPDRAEQAMWYRFDQPPMRDDGTMDPLALVVMADSMPGAVGEKTGRRGGEWFAPSVDLTVHILDLCRSEWVLAHNTARHAGDGYASADMALWDCGDDGVGEPRLVAYATQVFVFSFR